MSVPDRTMMALGAASVVPVWMVGTKTSPVSWDKEAKKFTAEASSLEWTKGTVALKSARTGDIRFFDNAVPGFGATCPDGCCGGELTHWSLKSRDGFELVIFND